MNTLIAFCGLDCEKCEARKATVNNDDELRKAVAKKWSEFNHVEITPDMINCLGCRSEGPKTPYCEKYCPIRKCARKKGFTTCGDCPTLESCKDLGMVIGNNSEAAKNLKP
jgi:hypothetical protein